MRAALLCLAAILAVVVALCAAPDGAWAKSGGRTSSDQGNLAATAALEGREALTRRAMPGKNNIGKANVVQLFGYSEGRLGYSAEDPITTETVSGYDVTGDGLADRLRATITPQGSSEGNVEAISDLRFYVNGLLALDIDGFTDQDHDPFSPLFTVDLITLKNDQEFLLVNRKDKSGTKGTGALYHYRDGSFEKVLDTEGFARGSRIQEHRISARSYGNNVDITYTGIGNFLKWTKITMSYAYDKQTDSLKLRGNDARGIVYEYYKGTGSRTDVRNYTFGKPVLTAVKPFKVTEGAASEKVAFTVGKGSKVIIVGATVADDRLFFKVRAANGKTGYVDAAKGLLSYAQYGATRWFEEVGF